MQMDWAVGGGPCWWCGKPSLGRVWGQGDEQWMSICPECVRALKAALPDAPDWERVARQSILNIEHIAGLFGADVPGNRRKHAQAILAAAQRLVEATGHLQGET